MGMDFTVTGLDDGDWAGAELLINADDADVPALTGWLKAHGDDDPVMVFGAKRHQFVGPGKVISLQPGHSATRLIGELTPEITGMALDLASVRLENSDLHFSGTAQRLVPDSGWLGRMGLFRVDFTLANVESFVTQDLLTDQALAVEHVHFDPACRRFAIGSAIHGALVAITDQSTIEIAIALQPTEIRRWRRFSPA